MTVSYLSGSGGQCSVCTDLGPIWNRNNRLGHRTSNQSSEELTHSICKNCFDSWALEKESPSCPECRFEIDSVNGVPIQKFRQQLLTKEFISAIKAYNFERVAELMPKILDNQDILSDALEAIFRQLDIAKREPSMRVIKGLILTLACLTASKSEEGMFILACDNDDRKTVKEYLQSQRFLQRLTSKDLRLAFQRSSAALRRQLIQSSRGAEFSLLDSISSHRDRFFVLFAFLAVGLGCYLVHLKSKEKLLLKYKERSSYYRF